MKSDLNYCIVLSSEQLAYLAGSKYGIDRMKILHRLIEAAVLEETDYAIKGFSTTLQVGQAILSEVDLSCKLGYDKKTISRVLDKMNQLGIVASTQGNRTSVHTLKCVSAWMLDGNRIDNPFYVRIKDRQEEGENTGALSDDAKPLLPTPPLEENVSNSNDCSQSEVMNEYSNLRDREVATTNATVAALAIIGQLEGYITNIQKHCSTEGRGKDKTEREYSFL